MEGGFTGRVPIFQQKEEGVQTVAGIKEFLDLAEAAAIPMAVASSGSKARVERMLDKHGLSGGLAVVLTSDDVAVGKESPAIFLRAAEELHERPCDVLVLEDAVRAVEVVKKVGMKCIGIAAGSRGSKLAKAGADLVLSDFTELKLSDLLNLSQPPSGAEHKASRFLPELFPALCSSFASPDMAESRIWLSSGLCSFLVARQYSPAAANRLGPRCSTSP
jgi:hypothetical protein